MIFNINENQKLSDEEILKSKRKINKLIKEVTFNIDNFHFNVAVAKFYEFTNYMSRSLYENKAEVKLFREIFKNFLILIYPFTPHIASECWEKNYKNKLIHNSKWPSYNEKIIKDDNINVVIQINGKKKTLLNTSIDQDQELLFEKCLEIESVKKQIIGKNIVKKIYVKNKLINIVVK